MWAEAILMVFQMSPKTFQEVSADGLGTRMKPHWGGGEENLLSLIFKKKNGIRGPLLPVEYIDYLVPRPPPFSPRPTARFFPSLPCNELWSRD